MEVAKEAREVSEDSAARVKRPRVKKALVREGWRKKTAKPRATASAAGTMEMRRKE